jgi:hypothetical protein
MRMVEHRIEHQEAILVSCFLHQGDSGHRLKRAGFDGGVDRDLARGVRIEIETNGFFIAE